MKQDTWPMVLLLVFLFLPLDSWGQSSTVKKVKTTTIQVASIKQLEKAEQELTRLKSHGLDPFMRHELVGDKGMWYRIYVGRFETRADATTFAQDLKDRGIIAGFWVKRIEISIDTAKPSPAKEKVSEAPKTKTDLEQEKQPPPPAATEIPKTVAPPEEKPSVPQPPVDEPKIGIPEKAQVPPPQAKKEITDILPADDISEEEPISPEQGIAAQGPDKAAEVGRFSVGVKSSYFIASKAEDFIIDRTTASDSKAWSFKNAKIYTALISNYRLTPKISIEGSIEKAFFTKLDLWHLTAGPKYEFKKIRMLTPYARGSLVLGHLAWDEVPGDFDNAWGWEGGVGLSFIRSNIQMGLEASYRAIKYGYNRPSGEGVTATGSQLDFSGYALSGTVSYWF